jgi:SSS family solute:Na+ symporter
VTSAVFAVVLLAAAALGFAARRWRAQDLGSLEQWGLAGRPFGTALTWCVISGGVYTTYTFIAVPAVLYTSGALGFFAVPYTIIVYPMFLLVMPRLWKVARRHGHVTTADFVRDRYDSPGLALVVALTSMLATMPYIALQLVGIRVVLDAMGVSRPGLAGNLQLVVGLTVLAGMVYTSGLRAPALLSIVKAVLIFGTTTVAAVWITAKLGGTNAVFDAAARTLPTREPRPGSMLLMPGSYSAYSTLAVGSALALFLYPHTVTGVLSARSARAVRRNAIFLPAWSFLLGVFALFGFLAIAAGIETPRGRGALALPLLVRRLLPEWFTGLFFGAIVVGAVVSAGIMAVSASNVFSRNIYKEYLKPSATARQQAQTARAVSVVVTMGSILFVTGLKTQAAINLQLLGGVWILQTLPAVGIGLYTRWLHRWGLIAGWAVGMVAGTAMVASSGFVAVYGFSLGSVHFASYPALLALGLNLVVAAVLTPLLTRAGVPRGLDATDDAEYTPAYERVGVLWQRSS